MDASTGAEDPNTHFADFCTYGAKHLAFWNLGEGELNKTANTYGSTTVQDVLTACFAPGGHVLCGGPNGAITVYKGAEAIHEISAHASMCRCVKLHMTDEETLVLSGGGDGKIMTWEVVPEDPAFLVLQPEKTQDLTALDGSTPALIAIDCDPHDNKRFVAGTADNDIWEVDADPRPLVMGHSEFVFGLSPHPTKPAIYATGGEDGSLCIWRAMAVQKYECVRPAKVYLHADISEEDEEISELPVGFQLEAVERRGDADAVTSIRILIPNGVDDRVDQILETECREDGVSSLGLDAWVPVSQKGEAVLDFLQELEGPRCVKVLPIERMDDIKDEENDPELATGDGYSKDEPMKVRAVTWSDDGSRLALTTCGVAGDDGNDDEGGVVHVYRVDDEWFQGSDDEIDLEGAGFPGQYRLWETKDCNHTLNDVKFSHGYMEDGKLVEAGRYLAVGASDCSVYIYEDTRFHSFGLIENWLASLHLEAYHAAIAEEYSQLSELINATPEDIEKLVSRLKMKKGEEKSFRTQLPKKYRKCGLCVGHSSYITHIDWSTDVASAGGRAPVLMTNSGDYEILFWDPRSCKKILHTPRDLDFPSMSCVLGFPVMGIWQDGQCGNDINAAHRSNRRRKHLVTSGDDGLVRIFKYPAVMDKAASRACKGHSSFTESVRFSCDDTRVFSVGGKDRCVIQWRTHGVRQESKKFVPEQTIDTQLQVDPQMYIKLNRCKQEATANKSKLRDADRQITALKQKIALGAQGSLSEDVHAELSRAANASSNAPTMDMANVKSKIKSEWAKIAGGRGGGTMRINQFLAFLKQVGFRQSDVIGRKLFHAFDADKNGFIDLPEFSSAISLMCSGDKDEKVDFIFSLIDVDRDGSVSGSEVNIFIEGMFSLTTDVVSPPFSHQYYCIEID